MPRKATKKVAKKAVKKPLNAGMFFADKDKYQRSGGDLETYLRLGGKLQEGYGYAPVLSK